ncbi:heme lyase CcmF/NrfE family subunit [Myxococcota bacterium]|nr:heme lyase CcmF/NrfE family subunit [Myxococcota bacterium]
MNGPIGAGAVHAALACAAFGAVCGFVGGRRRSMDAWRLARGATYASFAAMSLAILTMVRALLTHDFSVWYVSRVGSLETPPFYTVISLWSSLEGSILLWGWILTVYAAALAFVYRRRHADYMPYTLGVLLSVSAFFTWLIAGPADPFEPVFPVPSNGPGPNPLLQNHPLMALHPPMLYAGYVGMAVPFAIASGALLRGRIGTAWLRPLRLWALIPWTFLTVGIVAGGWWSYEVLGWGGYWAWDPVENASFLPWLSATAFIHSLMVQERRGILKTWSLSLLMVTFLLTILGTFMTRSGVFNSVHSFSQSSIGPIFLAFLGVALFWCAGLLATRSELIASDGALPGPASREGAFLLNNVVFLAFTLTVLLGTVYPLLAEAIRGVRVSVGLPYFNRMGVPLGLAVLSLMGVGPALPWGRSDAARIRAQLLWPGLFGIAVACGCVAFGVVQPLPLLTFGLAGFVTFVTLREFWVPTRSRMSSSGAGALESLFHVVSRARRRYGGYVVHLGVVAMIVAITASWNYKLKVEATLDRGGSFRIGDYDVTFRDVRPVEESHRFSVVATLDVARDGEPVAVLQPRSNHYKIMGQFQREPIGTPAVHSTAAGDVYLTLLAFEKDGSQATIQGLWQPLVPWIWWSAGLMVLGSFVAMWPERRRRGRARGGVDGEAHAPRAEPAPPPGQAGAAAAEAAR